MATTFTSTARIALSWTQTQTDPNISTKTITDAGNQSYARVFSDGTGLNSADNVWHNSTGQLSVGGTDEIDLSNVNREVFGENVDSSFQNIKGVFVSNISSGSNPTGVDNSGTIHVSSTGTNGFTDLFYGATGSIPVPPLSSFGLTNYVVGWNVSGTNATIQLHDVHNQGAEYRIAVVGVKSA